MSSPAFDSERVYGPATEGPGQHVGNFHAAHVEKKLAAHAVYRVYADAKRIDIKTAARHKLTLKDLRALRDFRFRDGAAPRFVIALRPPTARQMACRICLRFVRDLSAATGIDIQLQVIGLQCSEVVEPTRKWRLKDLPEADDDLENEEEPEAAPSRKNLPGVEKAPGPDVEVAMQDVEQVPEQTGLGGDAHEVGKR